MPRLTRLFILFGLALILLVQPAPAEAQNWPEVFDPLVVSTFNLTMEPEDWETIRFDLTNDIEVPAMFWADDESPILVSVRRKSSRALPSESDPRKIGMKIDINEFVNNQVWHGLAKLSLENAGDVHVLHEGMAWQLHQLAAQAGYYGPEQYPALANWVRVTVNGELLGLYSNVEQRDTQYLRNRGVRPSGSVAWLYEIDDIDGWEFESGGPAHSPAFLALCYPPFAPTAKGKKAAACTTPSDPNLIAALETYIELDAMLAQGGVDAFTDNPDALFTHGKNYFYADFNHSGLKRRYIPWDLDAVFRSTSSSIYGKVSKKRITQTPFEDILLNHAGIRARYNNILASMIGGPLSASSLHAFLDALEPVLSPAIVEDPYITENPDETFASLRSWISERIPNVLSQIGANGPPSPR